MINELTVISGKGGTGKTSLSASFAVLAGRVVVADCDVDAADLHLVLSPRVLSRERFFCGNEAIIRWADCTGCGICESICRFGAIKAEENDGKGRMFKVDPAACEGCGVCVRFCPSNAIDFPESLSGEWMISDTRCGPMVHARLGVAAENSGKLVSLVRREARRIAEMEKIPGIIVDGPPGVGCPVIASVTGASRVLVVSEPTVSGEHDLLRALALVRHFGIPSAVCVNKWDINPEMAGRIERRAVESGAAIAGRIRYDSSVTGAQVAACPVVEMGGPAARDIEKVWANLMQGESGDGRE